MGVEKHNPPSIDIVRQYIYDLGADTIDAISNYKSSQSLEPFSGLSRSQGIYSDQSFWDYVALAGDTIWVITIQKKGYDTSLFKNNQYDLDIDEPTQFQEKHPGFDPEGITKLNRAAKTLWQKWKKKQDAGIERTTTTSPRTNIKVAGDYVEKKSGDIHYHER